MAAAHSSFSLAKGRHSSTETKSNRLAMAMCSNQCLPAALGFRVVDPLASSSFCEISETQGSYVHSDMVNISQDAAVETFKYSIVFMGKVGKCKDLVVVFDAVVTSGANTVDSVVYQPDEIALKITVINFPYSMELSSLALQELVASSASGFSSQSQQQAVQKDPLAIVFSGATSSYKLMQSTADDQKLSPSLFGTGLYPPSSDANVLSGVSNTAYVTLNAYVPAKLEFNSILGVKLEKQATNAYSSSSTRFSGKTGLFLATFIFPLLLLLA